MSLADKLGMYWQYPCVRCALLVGVLISLCSSLLGVTLVLRRYSFIGDGLSHVAFGAMAVAAVCSLTNDMPLVLGITVLCAVLLLRGGRDGRPSALAVGYLLMNLFSTSGNLSGDVCTTLFGSTSILTLSPPEVRLCTALSLLTVCAFLFFYHKVFAVTFDSAFAAATGVNTGACELIMSVVIAVIIVLAMKLVGSLLITALIVFPAMSAMRLFHSFRQVTVCAALLSVAASLAGILISVLGGTPVGSTIVAADILVYLLSALISRLGTANRKAG